MTVKKGYYTPNTVRYHIRKKGKVLNGVTCRGAFPLADRMLNRGLQTEDNAIAWAKNYGNRGYDSVDVDNDSRGGYRLVGFEQRREGGLAWKVVTPEGYLVDMRDDVFLPILLSKGLPADGLIPGEFKWGVRNGQMVLIEEGSALAATFAPVDPNFVPKPKKVAPIPARDLRVGAVYRVRKQRGETSTAMVYLGQNEELWQKHIWYPVRIKGTGVETRTANQIYRDSQHADWNTFAGAVIRVTTKPIALEEITEYGDVTLPKGMSCLYFKTIRDGLNQEVTVDNDRLYRYQNRMIAFPIKRVLLHPDR